MKFSVLMSLYYKDKEKDVIEAIESVTKSQTIKPNQFVLVKDGPIEPNLEEAINSYIKLCSDIEFTVIQIEKNCGLANALNIGLEGCKYEWIARMDADDISCDFRFEKQLEYIAKHKNVGVVGGAIEEFFEKPGDCGQQRSVPLKNDDIIKYSKKRNPINHMTVMYKKADVLSVGGYSTNCGKLEDYRLWIDLLNKGIEFGNLDEIVLYARIGNGFVSRRSDKREIVDWVNLQNYMLKNKYITVFRAFLNKIYIRIFIYLPPIIKKLAYKFVLRK